MNTKKLFTFLSVLLFTIYTFWWLWLYFSIDQQSYLRNYFTDTYGIIAGLGGLIGISVANKWGGIKSFVGKALLFFSAGLILQFLGQLSYTLEFYIYHIENSYPSIGELFYFSSIPAYILGVWFIGKASGSAISLRNIPNKLASIIFPILMIGFSYYMFIQGNSLEDASVVANILNFAYPIGQAIFVSMAIVAYYLSGKVLGGTMKPKVTMVLFSLVFQYAADSTFLYKTIAGTWYPADTSEYMFVISYFLMTLAFIQFLAGYELLNKKEN